MDDQDIRWKQRFDNYNKALAKMEEAVEYVKQNASDNGQNPSGNLGDVLNNLIKQGLIKSFEYTFELAWKVIKDYCAYQGNPEVNDSRDAFREAFALGLIKDGNMWMDMIQSRNRTSHTYNEDTATEIYNTIIHDYYPAFRAFQETMKEKATK